MPHLSKRHLPHPGFTKSGPQHLETLVAPQIQAVTALQTARTEEAREEIAQLDQILALKALRNSQHPVNSPLVDHHHHQALQSIRPSGTRLQKIRPIQEPLGRVTKQLI